MWGLKSSGVRRPEQAGGFNTEPRACSSAQCGKPFVNYRDSIWPHDARDFFAVAQEDQRGPEFDLERATERSAGPIFDLEMTYRRMFRRCLLDEWLGTLTVAAPVGTEFEHSCA